MLRISGLLQTPPELDEFSYRDYLARRGIHSIVSYPQITEIGPRTGSVLRRALYTLRDRAHHTIARLLPDPQASLLQGILLGVRSGIASQIQDEFDTAGASHVLVISGANLVIVAALFSQVLGRWLGRRRAYWFALLSIVLYTVFVGADTPVVRAAVMATLCITAQFLGRRSSGFASLCAAAVFITMLKPLALWDASFQLSFAAALSLVLFAPGLQATAASFLGNHLTASQVRWLLPIADLLIITLAVQLLTLPVMALTFERLSLVSPLVNALIAPAQPPIMVWGGAATAVGLVPGLEPLAQVVAWLAWLCITYTTAVVHWMAAWPMASISVDRTTAAWLLVGAVGILAAVWAWRHYVRSMERLHDWLATGARSKTLLGALTAASVLVWLAVLQAPDRRLHVVFLDVGEGDATLIITPSGQQILVDGGPSPAALSTGLGQHMPFWDRSLDLLISTHPDADHLTGLLTVLENYQVSAWFDNGELGAEPISSRCRNLLAAEGAARRVVGAGDRLVLGDGVLLEILGPLPESASASSNDNSIALRLSMAQSSLLLAGDIEAAGEQALLNSAQSLQADVLRVAHHGGAGSSTSQFLDAVNPHMAVISVAAENRYGHPAPELLERLASLPQLRILRTDQDGAIELVTGGQEIQVRTERRHEP
jgi:competence protein ComEC